MIILPRNILVGVVLFLLPGLFATATAQISPQLKQFLEQRDFLQLISSYGQEHITLTRSGETEQRLAAQPFTTEKGYRCQAFAGTDLANANRVAARLRALQLDSVYVIQTPQNIYKVQLGNFTMREDAEAMLATLREAHVEGAWVVETDIQSPRGAALPVGMPPAASAEPQLFYAVQVIATNDSLKAYHLMDELKIQFHQPAQLVKQSALWKVLIGRFSERAAAEEFLSLMRKQRYEDAWITQLKLN